jgi:hypothetical protein
LGRSWISDATFHVASRPGKDCFEAKPSVAEPVELPDQRSADGLNIFFHVHPRFTTNPCSAERPNVRSFDEKVE